MTLKSCLFFMRALHAYQRQTNKHTALRLLVTNIYSLVYHPTAWCTILQLGVPSYSLVYDVGRARTLAVHPSAKTCVTATAALRPMHMPCASALLRHDGQSTALQSVQA
jgi:hypothetical protein